MWWIVTKHTIEYVLFDRITLHGQCILESPLLGPSMFKKDIQDLGHMLVSRTSIALGFFGGTSKETCVRSGSDGNIESASSTDLFIL